MGTEHVTTGLHMQQITGELANVYGPGMGSCQRAQAELSTSSPFLVHLHGQGHSFPVGPGSIPRCASRPENVKSGKIQTNHLVQTI